MAYERAPIGKRLLYKLTELAIKEESVEEAEDYYREFCDLAGDDPRQYLLRYKLLKQKDAPKEQMIHALESYTAEELDEKQYTASAGGGAVSVTVSGKKEVVSVQLSEEVVDPDDIEMLQDLIVAATNEALRAAEEDSMAAMSKLSGGLGNMAGGFPF